MFKRIWSLIVKEFIHLINDWWMPAFMLFGGATELLLVGWATSRPITDLPLMVLDRDQSVVSRAVVTALGNTDTFALEAYAPDLCSVQDALDHGQINAALVSPPGFGNEMAHPAGDPTLSIWLSGAESIPAKAALQAAEGVVSAMGQRVTLRRIGLTEDDVAGFDVSLRVWFNEELSEALYTTPAELALMLEFVVLLFAALSFARERELVLHQDEFDTSGYRRLSLARASGVLNRQWTVAPCSLRGASQAAILRRSEFSSGMRSSRHCSERTLSSISTMFSQLPCLGV